MKYSFGQWKNILPKNIGKSRQNCFKLSNLYLIYTSVNDAYSDFVYRFVETVNFIAPAKRIKWKANWNFGLAVKLYQHYKNGINLTG